MKKNYYKLLTVLAEIAPNATLSEDVDGQIIVHTNLSESNGELYEMIEEN